MSSTIASASYREITDANGRVYRVGETDRDLLGRSRASMVWLPWIAMMAVSVFEYGYGAAAQTLRHAHGWSLSQTFWLLSIWALFQAGVAFPAGRLREKGIVSARAAMLAGAVLSAVGFFSIAHSNNLVIAYLGFAVCGGTGVGLVYATCINIVGKWYPERRGAKTGFVCSGFAYGAVPFIFIFSYALHPNTYVWVLDGVGLFMVVVVALCGARFQDPPKNWWPAEVDPEQWATSKSGAESLRKNPPAVRQYTPLEAVRTGMLPLMWLSLGITAGVSLFGISYMVPFAKDLGFGPLIAASSAGVLSVINGTGRTLTGYVSDRLGRKPLIVAGMALQGVALLAIVKVQGEGLWLAAAIALGLGTALVYPTLLAAVSDVAHPSWRASAVGVYRLWRDLGYVVGALAAGLIADVAGIATAIVAVALVTLASALITLLRLRETLPTQPGTASRARF